MDKKFYKISEAASLTSVTRQTLIFYDKKDILKPAFIDDNKYRYYSIDQIHLIQIINMLKEFDIPLKTIKTYLDNRDTDQMLKLLDEVKDNMMKRIAKTQEYISIIDHKKELLNKSINID